MKSKNNYIRTLCLCLTGIVVFFCFTPKAEAQTNNSNSKSTFDLIKEEKEIQLRLRDFENALKNRDSIEIGNLYTIDAEILNNGSPSTVGRDNIVKSFGEMIRDSITSSAFTTTGLWGNNELLVEQGTGFFAHSNGKVVARGRYLVVWKKDDGKWKIFRDSWFSD